MDTLNLKGEILEFYPDTLEAVRKDVNLESPERINEAINILEEWLEKQNHFLKKDFSRVYLEIILISMKGLVERTKQKLEKLCTYRTLMPEFYPNEITKESFIEVMEFCYNAHLPKLTKEHYRVHFIQFRSDSIDSSVISTYYKYLVLVTEYLILNDYNSGIAVVMDFRNINIFNLLTKVNPLALKQIMTLLTEGYGSRVKKIDLLSGSKMIDSVVKLFKQVLSPKLGDRINVHKNVDTIHEDVRAEIFPEDYGGKEKSLKELNEKWLDIVSSKDFVEIWQELNKAGIDESSRQAATISETYIDMHGCFRALNVD